MNSNLLLPIFIFFIVVSGKIIQEENSPIFFSPECDYQLRNESSQFYVHFPDCFNAYFKANPGCIKRVMDDFQPGECLNGFSEYKKCVEEYAGGVICDVRGIISNGTERYTSFIYQGIPTVCAKTAPDLAESGAQLAADCSAETGKECYYALLNCSMPEKKSGGGNSGLVFGLIFCIFVDKSQSKTFPLLDANDKNSYYRPMADGTI